MRAIANAMAAAMRSTGPSPNLRRVSGADAANPGPFETPRRGRRAAAVSLPGSSVLRGHEEIKRKEPRLAPWREPDARATEAPNPAGPGDRQGVLCRRRAGR